MLVHILNAVDEVAVIITIVCVKVYWVNQRSKMPLHYLLAAEVLHS